MFSEEIHALNCFHYKSRCGKKKKKMKGSGPVRSNTTVSLMSTVFYTVSFLLLLFTLEIFTKTCKK